VFKFSTYLIYFRHIIRLICKVTLSSPCRWDSFHPYSLLQWHPQSKNIWLNFIIKCWNSSFNAQCSRLIIVVVHVRVVKIYVAAVEALRKKERQDESQCPPPPNANVLFGRCFLKSHPVYDKLRVLLLCLSYFTDNSISSKKLLLGTNGKLIWFLVCSSNIQGWLNICTSCLLYS